MRTVLLKSLGQAFGISGMEEKNGKVTFSKDFMVNLKKILGDDVLKSSDFELNNDGSVTSGRPLTQRRITAIMKKATIVGSGEFNVHDYEAKLAEIKKDLVKLDTKSGFNTAFIDYFKFVEKSLNFLKNDMDNLVVENEEWIANNDIGDDNTGIPRYLINYKLPKSGLKPSLWGKADMREFLGNHMVNGVFHTEQYSNIPVLINTPAAMKALTDYIRTTVTNFVQGAIDLYLDAKDAGKVQQLIEKWNEAVSSRWSLIRRRLFTTTSSILKPSRTTWRSLSPHWKKSCSYATFGLSGSRGFWKTVKRPEVRKTISSSIRK